MLSSLAYVIRKTFAGTLTLVVFVLFLINVWFKFNPTDAALLLPLGLSAMIAAMAISHVLRVRLISTEVTARTLANRQQREIDIPLNPNDAFSLLAAAIRELPGVEHLESAPDSLQIRGKLNCFDPYRKKFLTGKRNQILAIITPCDDVARVSILCEPERAAWTDWFMKDDTSNLETMQALGRSIARRVTEHRQQEQSVLKQTVIEKELMVAKLKLLQAQVEPHFLYNTLASAQILTRTNPVGADQMLGNLITYLRYSLPRAEDSFSSLGEELARALAYLDIMKIRMGSRLQLKVEVADDLHTMLIPSMMLQTLIENAIKHGLEPQSGGGSVWILVRQTEHAVSITVADDGVGFSVANAGTGIGLHNVRERLHLAYGAAASFSIVANFPRGVAATITVPGNFVRGAKHA